ncbi:MAG: hypothetical protein JW967_06795 [Dehalococcoidales bacterium]|nr:hypothetical protein [Dehalococcoidales bacterium]
MLELYFFILGLVNSIILISIFLIRRNHLVFLERYGWVYFLLAIPAAYGIFLVVYEQKPVQYGIFLGIFIAFLALEWLFDWVLKIPFRENMKRYWKLVIPYIALYYAMNYGFAVMPWKHSLAWGIPMVVLFVIQIILNITSHPKGTAKSI